ncbi:DUF2631 domain-containing protein [Epidermidibacterium keratini]|uniref:DUF2631 domain-containing protein n=1 Tax=Epidermidibacterium keratini TaxID=1891644 RepID=A0A7L4YS38_9ACTN|nr:DUF2631 domain-containing protein [Epidermidibacterium keratini]QHC01868.1 DUF2631 domain-containing protein [Epidermidibacterium keratini]
MAGTTTDAHATNAHASNPAGVDTNDPDFWGWNHTFGKGARIGGFVVAIVLLLMTIGNHHGRVEDLWLALIAAIMLGALAYDASKRRKAWRK